jgi:hypothetical protein
MDRKYDLVINIIFSVVIRYLRKCMTQTTGKVWGMSQSVKKTYTKTYHFLRNLNLLKQKPKVDCLSHGCQKVITVSDTL